MSKYTVDSSTMTGIANAIRSKTGKTGAMSPSQMITEIDDIKLGLNVDLNVHITEDGHWIRPNNYPNLDTLYSTIGDNESCVYLTYDLTKTPNYGWIGVYCAGATFYASRGHISNNAFVADYTTSAMSSGTFFRQTLDSANGDVQLWKIYSSGNLTRIAFCTNTATNASNYPNNLQPCVERCGKMPYVTSVASSISTTASYVSTGTRWLQKDHIMVGKNSNVTTMTSMYAHCYDLVETSCGEWNTSGWKVTTIASAFLYCAHLQVLDLSGWDTSQWKVTSMESAWSGCISLRVLDISTWDTSNWTTLTAFASAWYRCYSLKELDLSEWTVDDWRPTTLQSVWNGCHSLKKLDVSTWDTSDWVITTLNSTWAYCESLEELPIENWDTSKWTISSLASTWYICSSLKELDLSKWVTTSWAVTSLSSTWNRCENLKSLNVSTWNTTHWAVTTINSAWNACYSLEELNLSGWVTTNWAVTNMGVAWASCYSLKTLSIQNWNTSNWAVTTLSQTFQNCITMENFDFTKWNTSNWPVTTIYYLFSGTTGAKKIDISTWDISNFALTEARYLFSDTFAEEVKFPSGLHGTVTNSKFTANLMYLTYYSGMDIDINQNLSNSARLTHDSLISIINRLPTVSSSKTLTIGQANKLKLTDAEIAVATQKGWTVA